MIYKWISVPFFGLFCKAAVKSSSSCCNSFSNQSRDTGDVYMDTNNCNKSLMRIKMLPTKRSRLCRSLLRTLSMYTFAAKVILTVHVCPKSVSPPLWHAVALLAGSKHGGSKAELCLHIYINRHKSHRRGGKWNFWWTVSGQLMWKWFILIKGLHWCHGRITLSGIFSDCETGISNQIDFILIKGICMCKRS